MPGACYGVSLEIGRRCAMHAGCAAVDVVQRRESAVCLRYEHTFLCSCPSSTCFCRLHRCLGTFTLFPSSTLLAPGAPFITPHSPRAPLPHSHDVLTLHAPTPHAPRPTRESLFHHRHRCCAARRRDERRGVFEGEAEVR